MYSLNAQSLTNQYRRELIERGRKDGGTEREREEGGRGMARRKKGRKEARRKERRKKLMLGRMKKKEGRNVMVADAAERW